MIKFISQSRIENNNKLTPEQKEKLKERLYRKYAGQLFIRTPLPISRLANYKKLSISSLSLLSAGVDSAGQLISYDEWKGAKEWDRYDDFLYTLKVSENINDPERNRIINTLENFILSLEKLPAKISPAASAR